MSMRADVYARRQARADLGDASAGGRRRPGRQQNAARCRPPALHAAQGRRREAGTLAARLGGARSRGEHAVAVLGVQHAAGRAAVRPHAHKHADVAAQLLHRVVQAPARSGLARERCARLHQLRVLPWDRKQ